MLRRVSSHLLVSSFLLHLHRSPTMSKRATPRSIPHCGTLDVGSSYSPLMKQLARQSVRGFTEALYLFTADVMACVMSRHGNFHGKLRKVARRSATRRTAPAESSREAIRCRATREREMILLPIFKRKPSPPCPASHPRLSSCFFLSLIEFAREHEALRFVWRFACDHELSLNCPKQLTIRWLLEGDTHK